MTAPSVLIAGGGIGGLTAALTLAKIGCSVRVFEQSRAFSEIGAGIQLSPNCSRVLLDLGLETALRDCAFIPEGTQFRNWRSGRVIAESVLGDSIAERYGAPYYHVHRADFLSLLVEAANAHPDIALETRAPVQQVHELGDRVQLVVAGSPHEGDLLIGADGIHSRIRSELWGSKRPQFTGNVAWRALVPTAQLPAGAVRPVSTVWWGPGRHFVHYYVRGGALVNCVCVVEKPGWEIESWTERGDPAELKADFAGWHSDVQLLIDQVEKDSLYKWALHDRPPMPRWGRGRITLLGDSCHPTLPFMAQGAAMAIEDAAVLAGCLRADADVSAALRRYEALRQPRTAAIQKGSRRNARVFHLYGLNAWLRNRAASMARNRTMDELYRYNPLTVAEHEPAADPQR
ncbi:MAG: FAD-dependent monooxygenase [Pseudomonadota bacterium]